MIPLFWLQKGKAVPKAFTEHEKETIPTQMQDKLFERHCLKKTNIPTKAVDEAIKKLSIANYAEHKAGKLSSGSFQRLEP